MHGIHFYTTIAIQTNKKYKIMIYGIFDGQKLIAFRGANTLELLGKAYLKRIFIDEGIEFSKKGIVKYLEGWVDWSQDTDEPATDPQDMIDQAVSTIVYSNVHFMDVDARAQITNKEREAVEKEITRLLNLPYTK